MDITVDINSQNVVIVNPIQNTIEVEVVLERLWDVVICKYTHVYIQLFLQVPIIALEGDISVRGKTVQTEITKALKVDEIIDKKVTLVVSYPGEFDNTREPKGKVKVMSYNVK